MSLQKQAEALLAIADAIEKQAAEVSEFVCDKCKHTTTLAKINAARKTVASEVGENITVSDISVVDKVTCPAPGCEGVLAFQETEASAGFYYDPDKKAVDESKETPADEKKETPEMQEKEKEEGTEKHEQPKKASVDYDSIDRYIKG